MPFSIMTSLRYYDVTHFLADPNDNCTAYVKLEIKDILFVRMFWFSVPIFIEKITINYENHVYCPVTLHLSFIPFGPPIRVGSVRDTSFTYLRILFNTKKTKTNNCLYLHIDENRGSIPIILPLWDPHKEGSDIRRPLILWDTFPPYLRMLSQQKIFLKFLIKIWGRSP